MQAKRNTWIIIAVVAVAGAALVINAIQPTQLNQIYEDSKRNESNVQSTTSQIKKQNSTVSANQFDRQLPYDSAYGPLVRSLRGIYFDRNLSVDTQGNLRLASDLKDIFDFFFSAIEEESLETVLSRIDEYLSYKLDEPALSQAKDALSRYVDYKSALYDFEMAGSEQIKGFMSGEGFEGLGEGFEGLDGRYLEFVAARMEEVKAMREEYLDSDLREAFFQSREQYDDYMLQKLTIQADDALDSDQKAQALAQLDSSMPDAFVQQRNNANPVAVLRTAVNAVQLGEPATNFSSDEKQKNALALRQARVTVVGVEATERLEQLDAERRGWNERYQKYLHDAAAIENNKGLTAEDKSQALERLREQSFSKSEALRVIALGKIE